MAQPSAEMMQMTAEQQQMAAYSMFNPYHLPPDMSMACQNFAPDIVQFYTNMQQMAPGTLPAPLVPGFSAPTEAMSQSLDARDSGNDTITPPLPPAAQGQHSSASSAATSPQFPGNAAPFQQLQNIQQQHLGMQVQPQQPQQQLPVVSSYAINNLLSSASTPDKQSPAIEVVDDTKENKKRRNTMPSAMNLSKRRPTPYENATMGMFTALYQPHINPWGYNLSERCQVCTDKPSGYHYGVLSCEGCKGFFRRTVHGEKPVCPNKANCLFSYENCIVDVQTRTRCGPCRYERCLFVGMKTSSVRKTDKNKQKAPPLFTDALSPAVNELVTSFQAALSPRVLLTSATEATAAVQKFIAGVAALKALFPESKDEKKGMMVDKLMPGLLTIRAAYSLDNVPFFDAANPATIEKLRTGIRNTVLLDEGLAMMSGLYILQAMNGSDSEAFDAYCLGLRQHVTSTHSQEKGAGDRLLTKLGLLP